MITDALFCTLDSVGIANVIGTARRSLCYAAPGIQRQVAEAMVEAANRLEGPDMLTVCLDFDERVMRMGYGDIKAVEKLRKAGIRVRSSPGLRTGMVIADKTGFIFTPTPLYLEAEPTVGDAPNAIRMSPEQVAEALARLSPVAKVIAIAPAETPEEKKRIEALPVDVGSEQIAFRIQQTALAIVDIALTIGETKHSIAESKFDIGSSTHGIVESMHEIDDSEFGFEDSNRPFQTRYRTSNGRFAAHCGCRPDHRALRMLLR